jgi:hypothetical protein
MPASPPSDIPPVPDDFLVQNSDAIDAKAIMEEIRRRVEDKKAAGLYRGVPRIALDTPPPPGADRRLEERLALLQTYARVSLEGEPISSHRPVLGKIIVGWKKFTRFWVRRYTDTIFLRQQAHNEEVAAVLDDMAGEIRELRERLKALEESKGGE